MEGPLYKYTKKSNLNQFFETGGLRIGTLYDFRKQEKHGNEVGDEGEGKKKLFMKNDNGPIQLDSEIKESVPLFLKDAIISPEGVTSGASLTIISQGHSIGPHAQINNARVKIISDGPISREFEDDDRYILSFSKIFDRDAMRQFGYDACFVIKDVEEFIAAISKVMRKQAVFEFVDSCIYSSRELHHEVGYIILPVLLKDKDYEYQQEVRMVWKPYHKTIKPRIIKSSDANRYCMIKHNLLISGESGFHCEV